MTARSAPVPVSLGDITDARSRIASTVTRTPTLAAPWAPGDLWLKAENLQPTGAFKLRGATSAIARLAPEIRSRGVVTHSSGNHGQAVAWAARAAGAPAVVVMPEGAAAVKIEGCRSLGAEVLLVPVEQRLATAHQVGAERGMTLIPPFDHVDVIAGQGTLALEVFDDLDDVDTLLVPVGGGGLVSGVAVAATALSPRTQVVGVESELAADARDSLVHRRRITWDEDRTRRTIADGTRATALGEVTFPIVMELVHDIVTVSEDQILQTVAQLARRAHLVAEPSGALGVAAYLADPDRYGRAVAIVSGGNIDPPLLVQALQLPS